LKAASERIVTRRRDSGDARRSVDSGGDDRLGDVTKRDGKTFEIRRAAYPELSRPGCSLPQQPAFET
jgi:hypothetical protein